MLTVVLISFEVPAKVNVSVSNVTVSLLPVSAAIINVVEIDSVVAPVILPFESTVITGIAVLEP